MRDRTRSVSTLVCSVPFPGCVTRHSQVVLQGNGVTCRRVPDNLGSNTSPGQGSRPVQDAADFGLGICSKVGTCISGRGTSRLGWWRSPWGTKILLLVRRSITGITRTQFAEVAAETDAYTVSTEARGNRIGLTACQGRWKRPGKVSSQLSKQLPAAG